jgi:Protein of unknown function (DUF5132)
MSQDTNPSTSNVSEITQKIVDHMRQSEAARSSAHGPIAGKSLFFFGAASAVAAMVAAPLLRPVARSVVKTAIKAGRKARQMGSALKEELEDISAEAHAELGDELPPNNHTPSEKGSSGESVGNRRGFKAGVE